MYGILGFIIYRLWGLRYVIDSISLSVAWKLLYTTLSITRRELGIIHSFTHYTVFIVLGIVFIVEGEKAQTAIRGLMFPETVINQPWTQCIKW